MRKEIRIFFTAFMFLTRLPVPKMTDHSPDYLNKAVKYFPLVGYVVGGISALVFLVFNKYISEDIAILASIIAGILTTGAFHEDGFADVCDAFGGGWTKEKILMIMKDSRLGTFGVVGLIAVLGAKYLLLKEIPKFTPDLHDPSTNIFYNYRYFLLIIIAAHSVSRLAPIIMTRWFEYVTDPDTSKSKPVTANKPSWITLVFASAFALAPFVFLSWHFLLALIPLPFIVFNMATWFKKWIGGYTGDCLGAVQQVSELVFYLGVIIVWRYII